MSLRAVAGGGPGGGGGTVTSVGLTSPNGTLSVTGSPVTTGGTINVDINTVQPANGGTGLTTLGTPGQVPTVNPGGTALIWQTPSGGGSGSVTSVSVSSNTLSVSGSPITSTGTIDVEFPNVTGIVYANGTTPPTAASAAQLASALGTQAISGNAANVTGTVQPAHGGTGVATLTGLVYGNGTAAMTAATASQIATALGTQNISGKAAGVTGTVGVANGGTGVATLSGIPFGNGASAFTAATSAQIASALGTATIAGNAANVTGVVGYANGGTGLSTLGSPGQVPTVDPTGTTIQWSTPSGGSGGGANNGGVIYSKGSQASITNTTTPTSLRSVTIPANAVTASGAIEIVIQWSWTNSSGGKTPAIILGGQTVISTTQTTNNGAMMYVRIANRDVTNQQVVYPSINSFSQTGAAPTILNVDMTQSQLLDFRMTLGSISDTGSVESVVVKVVNP